MAEILSGVIAPCMGMATVVAILVFLSEFGMLVLRSSLPVGLRDLTLVFIERTVITAPLLYIGAMLLTSG